MRQFILTNRYGQTYNVTEREKTFLGNVAGLGFSSALTMYRVNDRYNIIADELEEQEISGEVYFTSENRRNDYREFVLFCRMRPLTLSYQYEGHTFYRSVNVKAIDKAETSPRMAGVTMQALSPWYERVYIATEADQGDGKRYDYRYDYTYISVISMNLSLRSDTTEASPCRLIINGPVENPVWYHYVNGVLVGRGGVTGEVLEGERLIVSSLDYTMDRVDSGGTLVQDMYPLRNFGEEGFIFLGYGENLITVAHDGTNDVKLEMEAYLEYVSV